jgi:hypothetical protein
MEGIRLAGTFGLYRGATSADVINDDGRTVEVNPGDSVFVSFVIPSPPFSQSPH